MLNLIVIIFNLMYHFMWDFFVRVVCERECVKTQGKLKTKEVFTGSSRVAFPRNEACAQHMTGMRKVMIDGDSWFLRVSHG